MTETDLIGAGIKTLRKIKNMTLEDVARATGFSISYLSKVERNQGSVTLDAIAKICAAFEMDVVDFLRMDFNKDTVHIHKEDRKVIFYREGIVKYELLTHGLMKKIKGLLITLYPTNSQGFAKIAMPHTTDELAFIIEGEMILAVDDKERPSHKLCKPPERCKIESTDQEVLLWQEEIEIRNVKQSVKR